MSPLLMYKLCQVREHQNHHSCLVLQALQTIQLTPKGVREIESISAVRKAIYESDSILTSNPCIAAASHDEPQHLQPQRDRAYSPDSDRGRPRPNSPTQRFQSLPVYLASPQRLPQRLHTSMRSASSSPESRAAPKAPYHHSLEAGSTGTGQSPQRINEDQPYHTLGRDYPPSSSAGLSA